MHVFLFFFALNARILPVVNLLLSNVYCSEVIFGFRWWRFVLLKLLGRLLRLDYSEMSVGWKLKDVSLLTQPAMTILNVLLDRLNPHRHIYVLRTWAIDIWRVPTWKMLLKNRNNPTRMSRACEPTTWNHRVDRKTQLWWIWPFEDVLSTFFLHWLANLFVVVQIVKFD